MEIILKKQVKSPVIINGFPGIGLVGTIACEFLLEHLKVEQIGKITMEEIPPMIAVHKNQIIDPFGVFYSKKYNILLMHTIAATQGFEWKIADFIMKLAKKVNAKEVISIEGIAGNDPNSSKALVYSTDQKKMAKLEKIGLTPLKEGIIMGVTGALMMKIANHPLTCVFAETHSQLPDSKAAAKTIETLDKYLGLNVDYDPLLKQAEGFEDKLQNIMKKTAEASDLSEKKRMNYVG